MFRLDSPPFGETKRSPQSIPITGMLWGLLGLKEAGHTSFLSLAWCSLLSADCNASILERHRQSYYHYHQGTTDKPSITTNVNIPENEKAAHGSALVTSRLWTTVFFFFECWRVRVMCFSKNLQIWQICISGALFLFYASKILKLPKIIPHCLHLFCQCNLARVPSLELPASNRLHIVIPKFCVFSGLSVIPFCNVNSGSPFRNSSALRYRIPSSSFRPSPR